MKKTLLIVAMAALLSACGGSSSDNSSTNNPNNGGGNSDNGNNNPPNGGSTTPDVNTKTGVFTDGKISGVNYTTSSGLKGTTNQQGEFSFNDGDSVTFSIANVQIGETTPAKAYVTPLDLAKDQNSHRCNW